MKTVIICKPTDKSVSFECKHCGRHIFVNSLCKLERCPRCNKKFKKIIRIERS